jgi:hypothetical protein
MAYAGVESRPPKCLVAKNEPARALKTSTQAMIPEIGWGDVGSCRAKMSTPRRQSSSPMTVPPIPR